MNGNCYLFCAGSYYGLEERPGQGDMVIAVDAGYSVCRRERLRPDIVLGDFDSLGKAPEGETVIRVPAEKDDTDTLLALKTGMERGCRRFQIYGGTGGRLDHTIANLQTLIYAAANGAQAYLHDRDFVYTAFSDGELCINGESGGIFSVFCLTGRTEGVSIQGGKYPLENAVLTSAFPLGVSNSFLGDAAKIIAKKGTLVVGWQVPRGGQKV